MILNIPSNLQDLGREAITRALEDAGVPFKNIEVAYVGRVLACMGDSPINTEGGLISRGHPIGATGAAMVTRSSASSPNEAGPRQIQRRIDRHFGEPLLS